MSACMFVGRIGVLVGTNTFRPTHQYAPHKPNSRKGPTMKTKLIKLLYRTIIITISISTLAITTSAATDIRVTLNGDELTFDVAPQIIDDRTMVPMRAIFEAMGTEVEWDSDTQTITATQGDKTIIMQIDNVAMSVNGQTIALDVGPMLIDGRTLVPVRAVAEGLDADVQWNAEVRTVVITRQERDEADTTINLELIRVFPNRNSAVFDVRLAFEQRRLPELVFGDSERFISLINDGNIGEIEDIVRGEWNFISMGAVAHYLTSSRAGYSQNDMPRLLEATTRTRAELGLGDNQIAFVSLEWLDAGTRAVVIEMYCIERTMLSTFIAIVYDEADGLMIYSLERGFEIPRLDFDVFYTLYARTFENKSALFAVANSRSAFINAISDLKDDASDMHLNFSATVTIMGIRANEVRDIERQIVAYLSMYNNRGENITNQFEFGRIELRNIAQIIDGEVNCMMSLRAGQPFVLSAANANFRFSAVWNVGDLVDISVQARRFDRSFTEFRVQNVVIGDMTETAGSQLPVG